MNRILEGFGDIVEVIMIKKNAIQHELHQVIDMIISGIWVHSTLAGWDFADLELAKLNLQT